MIGARRGQTKIRAPRRQGVQGEDVDFDSTWNTLAAAFTEIHTKNAGKLSYEELYRFAYRLVLKKQGERLYDKVKQFERDWLAHNVRKDIADQAKTSLYAGERGSSTSTATERRVSGENFLREMQVKWEEHALCVGMLADVLMYMDRVYCKDNRKPNMYDTGMDLFRDCNLHSRVILEDVDSPSLLQFLGIIILDQISMERAGDVIDRGLIKACIWMLEALNEPNADSSDVKLYHSSFEEDFLDASRQFYREEGERLLRECDAGSYCDKVTSRIREEQTRCQAMLSEGTTPKIERVVEDELIRHKIQEIIEMDSGVHFMIDNDRLGELQMIYDLEGRVDERKSELMKALQKRVMGLGTGINEAAIAGSSGAPVSAPTEEGSKDKDEAAPAAAGKAGNLQTSSAITWVADVLRLKEKFDKILNTSFGGDTGLGAALTRAFSDFINNGTFTRSSEFISLFIDENMKKGIKDKTEAEIDATLSSAITLLRYVQDKDLFERYYKKHLSKRLIMGKSLNIDVEKDMISRMKIDLGNTFTQKLEAMFKDITISEELVRGYRAHVNSLGDADPSRVDLNIHVLTSMTWPIEALGSSSSGGDDADKPRGLGENRELSIVYPSAVERVKRGFEKFYGEKHNGRKLTWMPNMGTADMIARFSKNYRVNVPTYGMIVLLLFNDLPAGASLSYEDIQARTNIPEHELVRTLQSLSVAPKTRLLRKQPMSRDINPKDSFSINDSFTSKFLNIKVGVVTAGGAGATNKVETERERRETEKKNDDTRRFAIEAAIVRIMKQRQTLAHQQLIVETVGQLKGRFKPDIGMIKQRVDALIDREYLERIEDAQPPAYRYLA